jgi:hypothetical protein
MCVCVCVCVCVYVCVSLCVCVICKALQGNARQGKANKCKERSKTNRRRERRLYPEGAVGGDGDTQGLQQTDRSEVVVVTVVGRVDMTEASVRVDTLGLCVDVLVRAYCFVFCARMCVCMYVYTNMCECMCSRL